MLRGLFTIGSIEQKSCPRCAWQSALIMPVRGYMATRKLQCHYDSRSHSAGRKAGCSSHDPCWGLQYLASVYLCITGMHNLLLLR